MIGKGGEARIDIRSSDEKREKERKKKRIGLGDAGLEVEICSPFVLCPNRSGRRQINYDSTVRW